ncbi:MAG: hypothetical protein ABWY06_05235 [Pseudomonas sp.]|uniref:hypothetical protein n=1 Tax=Pseudomonas sp. TaxID=306 RepID=UPI00339426C8
MWKAMVVTLGVWAALPAVAGLVESIPDKVCPTLLNLGLEGREWQEGAGGFSCTSDRVAFEPTNSTLSFSAAGDVTQVAQVLLVLDMPSLPGSSQEFSLRNILGAAASDMAVKVLGAPLSSEARKVIADGVAPTMFVVGSGSVYMTRVDTPDGQGYALQLLLK